MAQDFSQDNIDRWNEENNKSSLQKISEGLTGHYGFADSPLPKVPDIYGPNSAQNQFTRSNPAFVTSGRQEAADVLPPPVSQPNMTPSDGGVTNPTQDPYARIPENQQARYFALNGRNPDPKAIDNYLKYNSFPGTAPAPTLTNSGPNRKTRTSVKRSRASSVLPSPPQEQYVEEGMAPTGLENTTFIHGGDPTTRGMDTLPEGWAHLNLNDPSHVNELNRRASLNVLPQGPQSVQTVNGSRVGQADFTGGGAGEGGWRRVMPGFQYPNTPAGHIKNAIDQVNNEMGAMTFKSPEDKAKWYAGRLDEAVKAGGGMGDKEIAGQWGVEHQKTANEGALAATKLNNASAMAIAKLNLAKTVLPEQKQAEAEKAAIAKEGFARIHNSYQNFGKNWEAIKKAHLSDDPNDRVSKAQQEQQLRDLQTEFFGSMGVTDPQVASAPVNPNVFVDELQSKIKRPLTAQEKQQALAKHRDILSARQAYMDRYFQSIGYHQGNRGLASSANPIFQPNDQSQE